MQMMYVAVVEVQTTRPVHLEETLTTLGDYGPVLGTSARGWVEVEMTFSATGLAHACAKAAGLARAATGAEPIAAQVMTQQEYVARLAPGVAEVGRHASDGERLVLPRQATDSWEPQQRAPGRHSA